LKRHGVLDGRRRKRWTPPPTGWYLKPLAKKLAELDQFDYIKDLCTEDGTTFQVLNAISLHGKLADSVADCFFCTIPQKTSTSHNCMFTPNWQMLP
jgi:hypothetical protein